MFLSQWTWGKLYNRMLIPEKEPCQEIQSAGGKLGLWLLTSNFYILVAFFCNIDQPYTCSKNHSPTWTPMVLFYETVSEINMIYSSSKWNSWSLSQLWQSDSNINLKSVFYVAYSKWNFSEICACRPRWNAPALQPVLLSFHLSSGYSVQTP